MRRDDETHTATQMAPHRENRWGFEATRSAVGKQFISVAEQAKQGYHSQTIAKHFSQMQLLGNTIKATQTFQVARFESD
jgi:hypothetical protein